MVVQVLANPVDGILLLADIVVVLTNDGPVLRDFISHKLLVDAKVINFESTLSIGVVVILKLFIKFKGGTLELLNLQFFGGDGPVQVLNLEVEYKFKLF